MGEVVRLQPDAPDEWVATDAKRWNEAMQLRQVYEDGVEDAKAEKQDAD